MTIPRHAYTRQQEAFANLDELARVANEGVGHRSIARLVHDIRTDINHLTRQADKWQEYCRDTGHDPFLPWNREAP